MPIPPRCSRRWPQRPAVTPDSGSRIGRRFAKRLAHAADRLESLDLGFLEVELQAAMAGSLARRRPGHRRGAGRGRQAHCGGGRRVPLLVDRILRRDLAGAELLMGSLRAMAEESAVPAGWSAVPSAWSRSCTGLTGTITHLRAYPVNAWDEVTTAGAVVALARSTGLRLADDAVGEVHAQLGLGVPYHVQHGRDPAGRRPPRRPPGHRRRRGPGVRRTSRPGWAESSARAMRSVWPVTCLPRQQWPSS